ncbi:MAG: hypothetical protein IIA33_09875 [Planctomycetes bacterium]|nr:hypothetical protein [Planctomycetota bacterium]
MVERTSVLGDENIGVVADLDLGDVAPYPIAVSFKDFTLARVVIHAHVETHVADVGLGRDGPQQVSLAVAADQDSRACYVLLHNYDSILDDFTLNDNNEDKPIMLDPAAAPEGGVLPKIEFVRVEYDIDKAVAKVKAVPELDDFLGERLYEGR